MNPPSEILQALYRGDPVDAPDGDLDVLEAAALGRVDRVRALLDEDPERVHGRSADDFTPLHYAVFFDGADAAALLLERGADANAWAENEQLHVTPLHSAAAARNVAAVRILVDAGADPTVANRNGHTPLSAAEQHGDEELIALLRP
jgi:ankyrin repeat protein